MKRTNETHFTPSINERSSHNNKFEIRKKWIRNINKIHEKAQIANAVCGYICGSSSIIQLFVWLIAVNGEVFYQITCLSDNETRIQILQCHIWNLGVKFHNHDSMGWSMQLMTLLILN